MSNGFRGTVSEYQALYMEKNAHLEQFLEQVTPPAAPAAPQPGKRELRLLLNGEPLALPIRDNDAPYYLMDLLEYSGIDFEHLDRPVRLEVNGQERGFQYQIKEQDSVSIQLA